MIIKAALLAVLALSFIAAPASAQRPGEKAFAAAIAPEQAFETCHAETAEKAAECALAKCRKTGGAECRVQTACGAGWSGVVGIELKEVHFSEAVCGAPSEATVRQTLIAYCRARLKDLRTCHLASLFSPEGREIKVGKSWTSKTLPNR